MPLTESNWCCGSAGIYNLLQPELVGDVGDNHQEEISRIEVRKNHGWPILEGDQCYPPGTENCDKESTVLPIASFEHTFIRSVIGGYVYRGEDIP